MVEMLICRQLVKHFNLHSSLSLTMHIQGIENPTGSTLQTYHESQHLTTISVAKLASMLSREVARAVQLVPGLTPQPSLPTVSLLSQQPEQPFAKCSYIMSSSPQNSTVASHCVYKTVQSPCCALPPTSSCALSTAHSFPLQGVCSEL